MLYILGGALRAEREDPVILSTVVAVFFHAAKVLAQPTHTETLGASLPATSMGFVPHSFIL